MWVIFRRVASTTCVITLAKFLQVFLCKKPVKNGLPLPVLHLIFIVSYDYTVILGKKGINIHQFQFAS